jgi:hypothetical protein
MAYMDVTHEIVADHPVHGLTVLARLCTRKEMPELDFSRWNKNGYMNARAVKLTQNRRSCPGCAERYPLLNGLHDVPGGVKFRCTNG